MTYSLATASVSAAALLTTYSISTSHPKNETLAQAINIGNLNDQSSSTSVDDQGSDPGAAISTSFVAEAGTVTLSQDFTNVVQQASADYQLYNSSGLLIADNQGSAAQQTAYDEWVAGTLDVAADTYTATVTPNSAFPDLALNVNSSEQEGTSLQVKSQLTGSDPSEYYNFSLSGDNLKLAFDGGANTSAARVQIFNSTGGLVADSGGDPYQQANYQALTSGTGLTASSGNYTVAVSYAPNADTNQNVNYNFQLYSGNSYAVVYNNNVTAQPTDNSALGSVTASSTAQLYERQAFNSIQGTSATPVNAGWIQENKSALDIYSQLTSADSADYYSFTLQQGNNLKLGLNTKTTQNASDLHIQLLNSTGTAVIADNDGTPAQQAAYQALTTSNGLQATAGTYQVKVSYLPGAPKTSSIYEFGIYSGTTYASLYKTLASAQTGANALASGDFGGTGSSPAEALASYLTAESNGDAPNILQTIYNLA